MTKEELQAWALSNGWQQMGEHICLVKPTKPAESIVRLVLKATVAQIEIKKRELCKNRLRRLRRTPDRPRPRNNLGPHHAHARQQRPPRLRELEKVLTPRCFGARVAHSA
jgi:hypothetical protein